MVRVRIRKIHYSCRRNKGVPKHRGVTLEKVKICCFDILQMSVNGDQVLANLSLHPNPYPYSNPYPSPNTITLPYLTPILTLALTLTITIALTLLLCFCVNGDTTFLCVPFVLVG